MGHTAQLSYTCASLPFRPSFSVATTDMSMRFQSFIRLRSGAYIADMKKRKEGEKFLRAKKANNGSYSSDSSHFLNARTERGDAEIVGNEWHVQEQIRKREKCSRKDGKFLKLDILEKFLNRKNRKKSNKIEKIKRLPILLMLLP